MATSYKTPGVYIDEIAKFPPSIAEVETAIPAFVGYTASASANGVPLKSTTINSVTVYEAVRITSLLDYETYFGKGVNENIAVTISETYVGASTSPVNPGTLSKRTVSAVVTPSKHTLYYHMQMYFANGGGPCYIISVGSTSDAVSKDNLMAGLVMAKQYDEPTLLVAPQAALLSLGDANAVYTAALQQAALLKDRFVIMDVQDNPDPLVDDALQFRNNTPADNLKYGAAYYPALRTSLGYQYDPAAITITLKKDMNADGDFGDSAAGGFPADSSATVLFSDLGNDVQALVKQEIEKLRVTLSPSATIAGVYAAVDNARGVWKAPANVSLNLVNGPSVVVGDLAQEGFNVDSTGKSINVIRTFAGKGNLVWGARTLAGNDNEWRYINVRRLFNMVEESTKKATEAFVFEANDANTWVKVQGMIENYLTTLWRAGALQGAKPEHAFYVSVGLGKTMTAQDILEGRMYVEIGMAAVRPAEFIILRFSHKLAES